VPTVPTSPRAVALWLIALAGLLVPTAVAAPPTGVPFSPSSPFNLLVPPNAPVASNGGSLSGRTLGVAYAEYTPAVFVSSPSDPQYTIRLTSGWGPNPLNGKRVRIPAAARRANDSDGHLTIVVPQENLVISLYQAAQGPSGGTWNATWGGMAPLNGSGGNQRDSGGGRESGISQLAGLISPDDVRRGIAMGANGDLGHALAMLHNQVSNRSFVHPAISPGGNSSSGLFMGQRVYLDPSLDVNSIRFEGDARAQRFGRLVARTLQRYGAIVVTNSAATGFQMVNPVSYTSVGQANPWPELVGPDRSGYYNFTVRAIPSSRLRAMATSATGVAGPGAGATPPPTTTPAPTTGTRNRTSLTGSRWIRVVRRLGVRSTSQVSFAVTVRSTRAATVKVGARSNDPRGPRKVSRRVATVKAGGSTTIVVRVPVLAGVRAKVTLVVTARDTRGRTVLLQRKTLGFGASGA
jgi:hypothetical protein